MAVRRKASLPRRLFEAARALDAAGRPEHVVCREAARDARDRRESLNQLALSVYWALERLDAAMKGPATPERGKAVAAIGNDLELAVDRAWHFGLGNDFLTAAQKAKIRPAPTSTTG